jgi:transposase-like protein
LFTDIGYTSSVRRCIHIKIRTKFNLIHEHDWTGNTVSDICKKYNVSRRTYYKWRNRHKRQGIEGLNDLSRKPHIVKYRKITNEIEETILD